jgi:hypothetical protein
MVEEVYVGTIKPAYNDRVTLFPPVSLGYLQIALRFVPCYLTYPVKILDSLPMFDMVFDRKYDPFLVNRYHLTVPVRKIG